MVHAVAVAALAPCCTVACCLQATLSAYHVLHSLAVTAGAVHSPAPAAGSPALAPDTRGASFALDGGCGGRSAAPGHKGPSRHQRERSENLPGLPTIRRLESAASARRVGAGGSPDGGRGASTVSGSPALSDDFLRSSREEAQRRVGQTRPQHSPQVNCMPDRCCGACLMQMCLL